MTTTSPAAARERMSRVDTAWLRMDNDVNLMMIVGVWLLRPRLSYDALCRRVGTKPLASERSRAPVERDGAAAHWRLADDFELRHHVVREKLKRRRGQSERAALQERVGALASEPLDPARPPWQFHLVGGHLGDDYARRGGRDAVGRDDPAIGDGAEWGSVRPAAGAAAARWGGQPGEPGGRDGDRGDCDRWRDVERDCDCDDECQRGGLVYQLGDHRNGGRSHVELLGSLAHGGDLDDHYDHGRPCDAAEYHDPAPVDGREWGRVHHAAGAPGAGCGGQPGWRRRCDGDRGDRVGPRGRHAE